jgi:hypothetical protein
VIRALIGLIELPLAESTSAYGEAFEHFIINQCIQLASYFHRNYRFSYLATKDDAEIDLVVERPGQKILFIDDSFSERPDSINWPKVQCVDPSIFIDKVVFSS